MDDKNTMQDELARHLARHCKAWGIEDDHIAAHETSRAALEFIRERLDLTLSLVPSPTYNPQVSE